MPPNTVAETNYPGPKSALLRARHIQPYRGSAEKALGDGFHEHRQRLDQPTTEQRAVRQGKNDAEHRCGDNCLHWLSMTAMA